MALQDKPTDAQLSMLYSKAMWRLKDTLLLRSALAWLKDNATRGQVSEEITRVGSLYDKHNLDDDTFFAGSVWDGFKSKE